MSSLPSDSPRPKLHAVAVELTAYCNQKCDYCYNAWREDGGASVAAGSRGVLFDRVERLLETFDIDHFTLTGGEPFAHKDVFSLIERLAQARVGVQMISNGGLITDAIAERLSKLPVHYVQITLNGPDAALHDELVGGVGHHDKTVAGIEALLRHGVPVVGCIVVTRKNARHVGEILERFRAFGIKSIALSRFSPAGYATSAIATLLPSRDDLHEAFSQAQPFAKERGMSIQCTMPVPPCAIEVERFSALQFGNCPVGTDLQELALGPDGRLRNCTLHGKSLQDVDVADPSVDLVAIVNAPERTRYRSKTPDFCSGCLHEHTCAGGCGAAAEWVLGDARAFPDPLVWQHVDDALGARLEGARSTKKRSLEVIA